ncbi:RNA helicase [Malassezia yamatoensis]|uniref:ATP-dependent RNA helicase n=1 Tax=Malassezia yamatoensis TaxID=253288 RepID=A0AAJ5YN31_9BASI|nr:RNA helicase [Malassezia yamatoensis]
MLFVPRGVGRLEQVGILRSVRHFRTSGPNHGVAQRARFKPTNKHRLDTVRSNAAHRTKTPTPKKPSRHAASLHEQDEARAGELPPLEFESVEAASTAARTFESPPLSQGLLSMVHQILGRRARPTIPQSQALTHFFQKPVNQTGTALLAAETGSGKTLAYLLPVLQQLHASRATCEHMDYQRVAAGSAPRLMPRAIILAPTHELVRQISEVAKALSHHADHKLRVECTSTGLFDQRTAKAFGQLQQYASQIDDMTAPAHSGAPLSPDVLITTPKRLRELCDEKHRTPFSLENVQSLVVDEADTLLDEGFRPDTSAIMKAVQNVGDVNILFVTATIPRTMSAFLREELPDLVTLASPNLHKLPAKLTARFVDPTGSKHLAILKEIFRIYTTPSCSEDQILVFCDHRKGVESLSHYLKLRNVDHVALTGDAEARSERTDKQLNLFLNKPYTKQVFDPKAPRVLITTSVLSRGLDFGPHVRHVFVPDAGRHGKISVHTANHNALELLHRAGRSARAGREGTVVFFDRTSAPGNAKVLINRSGKKKGVIRGQMDLLLQSLKHKRGREKRTSKKTEK